MTPVRQSGGVNWTIVAVVMGAALNLVYIGRSTGNIERGQTEMNRRLDARDQKDDMQDGRLNGVESRASSLETFKKAVEEGRYNNVIERGRVPSPVFAPQ